MKGNFIHTLSFFIWRNSQERKMIFLVEIYNRNSQNWNICKIFSSLGDLLFSCLNTPGMYQNETSYLFSTKRKKVYRSINEITIGLNGYQSPSSVFAVCWQDMAGVNHWSTHVYSRSLPCKNRLLRIQRIWRILLWWYSRVWLRT